MRGLDSVDWEALEHAYGPARDVPARLPLLVSRNARQRAQAMEWLTGSLWHQGSVYPATAEAVPFLLEALPSAPEPALLLEALSLFSTGEGWHDAHQHSPLLADRRHTPEFRATVREEREWVQFIRERVAAGSALYRELSAHADRQVRLWAAALLAGDFEALEAAYRHEKDPTVRAGHVLLVGPRQPDWLASVLRQDRDELVRVLAAFGLMRGGDPPPEARSLFLAAFALPQLEAAYCELPFAGDFYGDLGLAFSVLSPEEKAELLPRLTELVERGPWSESRAWALLTLALGEGAPTQPTLQQRRAVRAVALQAFPKPMTTYANIAQVLRAFGLPSTREGVEAWLGTPLRDEQNFGG